MLVMGNRLSRGPILQDMGITATPTVFEIYNIIDGH
jgi:hypothetical protein